MDAEKQAAFRELKAHYDQVTNKLRQVDSIKRQHEMSLRRAAYTAAFIDELPDAVNLYKSIGKAYFLEPKSEVMPFLEGIVKNSDVEMKAAVATKESLSKTQESLRNELNEMIKSVNAKVT